ncbi:hypothetical protein DUNSADRAFT_3383 [Dunaliella salina]|uniref:Uncharacterized protein n=1 Tax=Dunaliella salina TaxID=3046 RepID=A0ABQ7FVG0_DUNSA|nr:hypothetical protein DUNSADRAFT_3383 [Dunaliella salina]|eukprot:KAF5826369.1 hypothetical protein DUNSADRAFT_3383 [Dunaliella salina]
MGILDYVPQSAAEKARAWAEEVQNGLMLVWTQKLSNSTQQEQCAPAVRLLNERVTLVWAVVCLQDVRLLVPHLAKLVSPRNLETSSCVRNINM